MKGTNVMCFVFLVLGLFGVTNGQQFYLSYNTKDTKRVIDPEHLIKSSIVLSCLESSIRETEFSFLTRTGKTIGIFLRLSTDAFSLKPITENKKYSKNRSMVFVESLDLKRDEFIVIDLDVISGKHSIYKTYDKFKAQKLGPLLNFGYYNEITSGRTEEAVILFTLDIMKESQNILDYFEKLEKKQKSYKDQADIIGFMIFLFSMTFAVLGLLIALEWDRQNRVKSRYNKLIVHVLTGHEIKSFFDSKNSKGWCWICGCDVNKHECFTTTHKKCQLVSHLNCQAGMKGKCAKSERSLISCMYCFLLPDDQNVKIRNISNDEKNAVKSGKVNFMTIDNQSEVRKLFSLMHAIYKSKRGTDFCFPDELDQWVVFEGKIGRLSSAGDKIYKAVKEMSLTTEQSNKTTIDKNEENEEEEEEEEEPKKSDKQEEEINKNNIVTKKQYKSGKSECSKDSMNIHHDKFTLPNTKDGADHVILMREIEKQHD